MSMKNILFLLLAGTILLVGCSGVVESAGEKESAPTKAPNFSLQDINDKTVRLWDYEGSVVILNLFATWCPPCKDDIPDFIDLINEYGYKNSRRPAPYGRFQALF